MLTRGKFSKTYGRFEFRAKMPTGQGIWPAMWLLPQDEKYKGWAASGEIDVFESRGQEPGKVLGTLHYGSSWPANVHTGKDFVFPDKGTIADWHIYVLEWEPGEMRWFIDGKLYQTQNFWWSSSKRGGNGGAAPASEADLNPWPAPFDQNFFILLNVAVGGQFLGPPNDKTVFPVEMLVDYIRVYDKTTPYGATKPRGDGKFPFKK
jgi:beta-glucanase (GH16 family)